MMLEVSVKHSEDEIFRTADLQGLQDACLTSPLHPSKACRADFPLLVLCSAAVGLAVGKASFLIFFFFFFWGEIHVRLPPVSWARGEFKRAEVWQLKSNYPFANKGLKGFFYRNHGFTYHESLQKACPPPAPQCGCGLALSRLLP